MSNIKNNENFDICSMCGGMCCLKSGCDYSAKDFKDCSYNTLTRELAKGNISIVCFLKFKEGHDYEAFLYLRARNTNRDIIDLVSMKSRCLMLGDNGCMYDYKHRPEGGKNLIPRKDMDSPCVPDRDPKEIVMSWKPYQKTLKRIVLDYTGISFEKKLRIDVENLFYDILMEKFDYVSPLEREEMKNFVLLLAGTFPLEYKNANERYKSGNLLVRRKEV